MESKTLPKLDELTVDEKMDIMLQMMDDIDRICSLYKLRYYLAYGSLLGAIRHHGFIPWDDDIDIQMPREDYDKFIEIYSREGKFSITSPKAKYPFYYFAKVYNKETIKIEEGISYSKFPALGIDIDIFPLDNYNNIPIATNRVPNKRFFQFLYFLRDYAVDDITTKKSRKYPFFAYCLGVITHLIGNRFLMRIFEKAASSNNNKMSKFYTVYSGMKKLSIFSKNDYQTIIRHPFQDKYYNIPAGYDNILRTTYGDYMKLPPKDKQITHHKNIIYWNS